LIFLLLWLSW